MGNESGAFPDTPLTPDQDGYDDDDNNDDGNNNDGNGRYNLPPQNRYSTSTSTSSSQSRRNTNITTKSNFRINTFFSFKRESQEFYLSFSLFLAD